MSARRKDFADALGDLRTEFGRVRGNGRLDALAARARPKNAPPTKTDLLVIARELGVRASSEDSVRDLVARLILAAGAIRGELDRRSLQASHWNLDSPSRIDCACQAIMRADPLRHFQGCPARKEKKP